MNERTSPASPAHTLSSTTHDRRLSPTRLHPATIDTADVPLDSEGEESNIDRPEGFTDSGGLPHPIYTGDASGTIGDLPASASSTSISPIATSNRAVRRRGSSRSSSFASTADAVDSFLQDVSPHLSPRHASSILAAPAATNSQDSVMHAHRRDTSADITGRGMPGHSRDNSNTSGILVYTPTTKSGRSPRPRPPSTSAWSNFSLGREYGLDGSSDTDLSKTEQDHSSSPWEDSDALYLASSGALRLDAVHGRDGSFDVDLEDPEADDCASRDGPRRGITRRVKGTEAYYRQSRNAMKPSAEPKRQRSIIANVHSGLRKMSVRVVNLAQNESDGHTTLGGDAEEVLAPEAPRSIHESQLGDDDFAMSGGSQKAHVSVPQGNPLRGKSLGIFGPHSKIRNAALKVFLWSWTEPILLVLIVMNVVILTIQSAKNIYAHPRPTGAGYFRTWEDYALFVIFVAFTLEILARIVVAGFIFNAEESRHTRSYKERIDRLRARIDGVPVQAPDMQRSNTSSSSGAKMSHMAEWDYLPTANDSNPDLNGLDGQHKISAPASQRTASTSEMGHVEASYPPNAEGSSMKQSLDAGDEEFEVSSAARKRNGFRIHQDVPFVHALSSQRTRNVDASSQRAFLRHSWNRIDFLSVLAFWTVVMLASTGLESKQTLYIFRALAALRSARLLTITNGTATILRSLKQSAPLMVSVAFFVTFAMALFSIIGVYSFKGSFQRSCVWIDPRAEANITFGSQRCGGHVNASTGMIMTCLPQGRHAQAIGGPKGYICPLGQLCLDVGNPHNGTQSFDNVFAALLQVVIITGANGWADLMYDMIDAEYFASCLFFIVCLVLLNFWLMNILVAVIINTFGNIREETKHSAFAGRSRTNILDKEASRIEKEGRSFSTIWRRRIAFLSKWCWTAAIVADIGIQASKTARDSPERIRWLNQVELYFTLAFLVEIVSRFMSYLPNYRKFVRRTRNNVDTCLAIVTTVIQIPVIRNSAVYPWLTVFQLLRFYRVILAVPRMKALLAKVLSSVAGLVNMVIFLLLMNFIVAIVAVQFLRGQIPEDVDGETVQYSFYQIYNAFLAIYVVFSSENWPDILYGATSAEALRGQAWISAIFISGWFLFANFILLQMFIAVINEGFAIAENEKHKAQMQAFVERSQPQAPTANWVSRINPYRFMKARPGILTVDNLPTNLALPDGPPPLPNYMTGIEARGGEARPSRSQQASGTFISSLKRATVRRKPAAAGTVPPSGTTRSDRQEGGDYDSHWDATRDLGLLTSYAQRQPNASQESEMKRRAEQAEFIAGHPTYDRSLWIFSSKNPIRRLCQRIVESAYGQRLYGVKPYRTWVAAFKLLILCAIAGSVVVAAVATPLYRREYYLEYGNLRVTWFNLTEVSLGFIFVIEFIIKVVADGFIFTPNAYLLSVWNILDFFVLLTLLINVGTALSPSTFATSRFTRSLKAFRALRLINLSETMRQTFYDVMIVGASLIFDASILTLLYIIPFSVWGQNLFSGLLYSCSDGDVLGKLQCINEYNISPTGWDILVPRAWQNPYVWSFDSFRSAILILFEIVSLEGWVDVMNSAMSITSRDQQNIPDYSQYNSIFFLIYNLIGAIVVLTLFVSVIIENFSLRSGQALLTSEQQQWVDLKKLLVRQRPSRRPEDRPTGAFRSWCYDRAVAKHGWWSRMITGLYVIHVGVLASQTETQAGRVNDSRDFVFLGLTTVYLANIVVTIVGLGVRDFWSNGWNVFDLFAVIGSLATTLPLLLQRESQVATQLQKLFLVCICFKLVQRNNSLNKLFKTATASLPAILNVFGLWLTLFLVWAIMFLETFSLMRWQGNETWMQNYSTFSRAMVMLSFMSVGEGWNAFMHDYATEHPYCSSSMSYLFDDCGNATAAYVLFITWNVISMYIFANMLTGVVVENFSFVFSLYGKTTAVSREEMRIYKRVWSTFDVKRTGYLQRKDLVPFLSRLPGIFNVNIYPPDFRIKTLVSSSSIQGVSKMQSGRIVDGFDIDALNRTLHCMDRTLIARRKKQFNRLYQEALLCSEPGKGISFTNMLVMLAQYKLVQPDKALKFEELLEYRARQQLISDLMSLERVRGRLQTIFWRRTFLAHRAQQTVATTSVPRIIFEDSLSHQMSYPSNREMTKPHLTVDTGSADRNADAESTTAFDAGLLSPRSSIIRDSTGNDS